MSYPPVLILIIEEGGGGGGASDFFCPMVRFSHEEFNVVPERPFR